MVSSTVGSPTSTGWKRRSRAASFSTYLRYSSSVVAPTTRNSPAGQHGLEHVGSVHRALGAARAHDGVHLVDEGDDLAFGIGDLLEDRLEALLELAAVLGAGHHGADVQGHDPLVLEALGHVAGDDALGQPLGDGRLAHARLADEDGVVLRPAAEHLDHAADLVVTPDDRVELAPAGQLGEVAAEALQCLVLLLGVRVLGPLRAAQLLEHLKDGVAGDPVALEQIAQIPGVRPPGP